MLKSKLTLLLGGIVMAGSLYTYSGCAPVEGDDDTGATDTPAPTETPDPQGPVDLAYDASDVDVSCSGTSDSDWSFYAYVDGEASAEAGLEPIVTIYDNYDIDYYNHNPEEAWTETFTLNLDTSYPEGSYVVAQDWSRDVTEWVATFAEQEEDVNTIFQCQYKNDLTYVFCMADAVTFEDICVGVGKFPDVFCPDCASTADGI